MEKGIAFGTNPVIWLLLVFTRFQFESYYGSISFMSHNSNIDSLTFYVKNIANVELLWIWKLEYGYRNTVVQNAN
jgi:hypothetical protein